MSSIMEGKCNPSHGPGWGCFSLGGCHRARGKFEVRRLPNWLGRAPVS